MIKFYKYIYIVIYRWNLRNVGEADDPKFNALLGIAFILFITILNILLLTNILANFNLFPKGDLPKTPLVILLVILLIINYYFLIYNKNYKQINEEFKLLSKIKKRIWSFGVIFYIICSFLLLIFLATRH